jgi:hypothetical protein
LKPGERGFARDWTRPDSFSQIESVKDQMLDPLSLNELKRQEAEIRALAEQLHFTKAAILLNVAQPALSHQIKELENELGTSLVERTNRRVRLTAAGEVFLARAKRILEQVDQALRKTARV